MWQVSRFYHKVQKIFTYPLDYWSHFFMKTCIAQSVSMVQPQTLLCEQCSDESFVIATIMFGLSYPFSCSMPFEARWKVCKYLNTGGDFWTLLSFVPRPGSERSWFGNSCLLIMMLTSPTLTLSSRSRVDKLSHACKEFGLAFSLK